MAGVKNFLDRIVGLLRRYGAPREKRDVLIGCLECYNDGSGLHSFFGWGVEFKAGGVGVSYLWASDVKPEDRELTFMWERVGVDSISYRYPDQIEWKILAYEITHVQCGYDVPYYKIVEKGTDTFLGSHEPLYKLKRWC